MLAIVSLPLFWLMNGLIQGVKNQQQPIRSHQWPTLTRKTGSVSWLMKELKNQHPPALVVVALVIDRALVPRFCGSSVRLGIDATEQPHCNLPWRVLQGGLWLSIKSWRSSLSARLLTEPTLITVSSTSSEIPGPLTHQPEHLALVTGCRADGLFVKGSRPQRMKRREPSSNTTKHC